MASFKYSLDKNGRRTQAIESINGKQRTVNYSYDATGKLLEEKITEGGKTTLTSYTYDATGNRLSKTHNGVTTSYTYNANDQLVSEVTAGVETKYQWDANGNLIGKTTDQGEIKYTWNSNNRLIQIDDQIKQVKVNYTYDGKNNRIGRTMEQGGNITETQYLVDSERPFSEITVERTRINNGAWEEHSYLHTPDGIGDLLTQTKAGQTVHLYQDGQGSTRFVTDNTGVITETHSFDAFGDEVQAFGQTPTTTDIKHLYVGEYFDQEANFYHMRARDYAPGMGRFISMDEFEGIQILPITLNKYIYANADPINSTDPSGMFSLSALMSEISVQTVLTTMAVNLLTDITVELTVNYLIYNELSLQKIQIAVMNATSDPLNYVGGSKINNAGRIIGGTAKGLSRMIRELKKFMKSPNFKKAQGNHNIEIGLPGLTVQNQPKNYLIKSKKIYKKIFFSMYNKYKGGRIFELTYKIGKNANMGVNGFLYRLDWYDYKNLKFDIHYHLKGFGVNINHGKDL